MEASSQICINDVILLCPIESSVNKNEKPRRYSGTNYLCHIFKGIYCLDIGWHEFKK